MAVAASRTPTLAIATAAAISMYAGTAYALNMDVKHKEGKGSIYQPVDEKKTVGKAGDPTRDRIEG
ncbi:hypothetical protein WG66_010874 [Moniliophthora roreri]|uniref:Uncharacterized protein n=1 Tax=Moniliophthora roreri TaxID=221103 RepID=A0A0W0G9N6_MONRR|nr:hypothetical protein WG66_010874 [Moniliophthora roreri]